MLHRILTTPWNLHKDVYLRQDDRAVKSVGYPARPEARRVAALLGASRQLDIVAPPYHGIPFEDLYKSKFYMQLKKGGKNTQIIAPTRNSLPQLHLGKERGNNGRENLQADMLRFSAPAQSISDDLTEDNQLELHDSRRGHGGGRGMIFSNNCVRDSDIFMRSSQSVTERHSLGYDRFARTSNAQLTKGKTWPEYDPRSDELPPRVKRKNRRQHSRLNQLETVPDYRLPKHHYSNEKLHKPNSFCTHKSSQISDLDSSKRIDRSSRKRSCESATRHSTVRYHHDVVGLGVDLSVPNCVLSECPAETTSDTSPNDSTHDGSTTSSEGSDIVDRQSHISKSKSHLNPTQSSLHSSIPVEHSYSSNRITNRSPQSIHPDMSPASERKRSKGNMQGLNDLSYEGNQTHDYHEITEPGITKNRGHPGFGTDSWSQAYVNALSAARSRNLPRNFEDFINRKTRPYTFSYFSNDHRPTCKCHRCLQEAWKKKYSYSKSKKSKPASGMKTILGKVKMHDYFHFKPQKRSFEETE